MFNSTKALNSEGHWQVLPELLLTLFEPCFEISEYASNKTKSIPEGPRRFLIDFESPEHKKRVAILGDSSLYFLI
ncbi:hypothetical protein [Sphingobacterium mizutaii]|uniref:hypothetical protein n=1 Tax=Sphingobacterium mizutaii TaxID=1010 RepID=UPI0016498790|nr:hypothetical protein [Sphingobacterium mizutaii]